MKQLSFWMTSFFLFLLTGVNGQTATEAFQLSQSDPVGTARNLGTGNSMFAIGPDFSAIGLNPSGLGGYRKSEFLFSSSLSFTGYSTGLDDSGSMKQDGFSKFNLPNVGFVIYNQPRGSSWTSSNWAIGLNRVADYNRELSFSGNSQGSITDRWRELAEGLDPDDLNGFEEGLAFETGAIYDFEGDNIYETDYSINDQYALLKKESSFTEGGKSELFLAYGADFNQKLMIGFSVGIPFTNYTQNRIYEEQDDAGDGVPFFNDLEYASYINSSGYGINGKVGVTIKPTRFLNFALAFHSPTRLSMTDNFNSGITYDYTDENHDGPITESSDDGTFNYALRTPWSASGGAGVVIGKSGFVAAHVKFTDYASMKYDYSVKGNGDRYDAIQNSVNNNIKSIYGSALQINMGGEIVMNAYRLRGGVTLQQSAFNNDQSFDPSIHAGAGYRGDNFYVDLGYKLTTRDEGYLPYETESAPQPIVVADYTQHQLVATVGFKF